MIVMNIKNPNRNLLSHTIST